ncbi:MAG: hypothetical protein KC619_12685 [Myxococcales bacterium]|nr:hypothetical protein [Myxococcales bacterium]
MRRWSRVAWMIAALLVGGCDAPDEPCRRLTALGADTCGPGARCVLAHTPSLLSDPGLCAQLCARDADCPRGYCCVEGFPSGAHVCAD